MSVQWRDKWIVPHSFGLMAVIIAGLAMGSVAWPMKLMRKFQFKQWFLIMIMMLVDGPFSAVTGICALEKDASDSINRIIKATAVEVNQ